MVNLSTSSYPRWTSTLFTHIVSSIMVILVSSDQLVYCVPGSFASTGASTKLYLWKGRGVELFPVHSLCVCTIRRSSSVAPQSVALSSQWFTMRKSSFFFISGILWLGIVPTGIGFLTNSCHRSSAVPAGSAAFLLPKEGSSSKKSSLVVPKTGTPLQLKQKSRSSLARRCFNASGDIAAIADGTWH